MTNVSVRNGWESLPNGFDVEFRHSIPVRISDNGHGMTVPEEVLLEEVTALGKLHVCMGEWESGETAGLPGVTWTWIPASMTTFKLCTGRPAGWYSPVKFRWLIRSDTGSGDGPRSSATMLRRQQCHSNCAAHTKLV